MLLRLIAVARLILILNLSGCSESPGFSEEESFRSAEVPKQNNLSSVVPLEDPSSLQIIVFGDFGSLNVPMTTAMDTYHSKFINPDMVFLLGDNAYDHISSPSDYSFWYEHVARESKADHYAILGNFDYILNVDQMMLMEMHLADSRWIMPSRYYFKRFDKVNLCVWFLDTDRLDAAQVDWLDASIQSEKSTCTWTIVNGHHPGMVQASGPTFGSKTRGASLESIFDKHSIDIYMCGHHHNSQHFTNLPFNTHYFVVGQISLKHPFLGTPTRGQVVWGSDAEPAFLELNVSATQIAFAFHGGKTGSVIHSGTIAH